MNNRKKPNEGVNIISSGNKLSVNLGQANSNSSANILHTAASSTQLILKTAEHESFIIISFFPFSIHMICKFILFCAFFMHQWKYFHDWIFPRAQPARQKMLYTDTKPTINIQYIIKMYSKHYLKSWKIRFSFHSTKIR